MVADTACHQPPFSQDSYGVRRPVPPPRPSGNLPAPVGTWVDLLSGTCFTSLSFARLRHTHAVIIRFLLLCWLSFSLCCWQFARAVGLTRRRTCPLPVVIAVTVFVAILLPTSLALGRVMCCVWACKQRARYYSWARAYCWHWRLFGNECAPYSGDPRPCTTTTPSPSAARLILHLPMSFFISPHDPPLLC